MADDNYLKSSIHKVFYVIYIVLPTIISYRSNSARFFQFNILKHLQFTNSLFVIKTIPEWNQLAIVNRTSLYSFHAWKLSALG